MKKNSQKTVLYGENREQFQENWPKTNQNGWVPRFKIFFIKKQKTKNCGSLGL